MARRSKSPNAADLIDLVALLPWWCGVLLAVASYLLLHRMASPQPISSVPPGQVANMVTNGVWTALASVGQYFVPFICAVGATVSALRRSKRKGLVTHVAQSEVAAALDRMTWQQFELLVGEAFRLQGYRVVETGGGGADGGADLVLVKNGEKFLVQCKQWKAFKVGVTAVRELYGVMAAQGAAGGFVVTSGRFTGQAADFASGRNLTLVDGLQLHALIRQARISTAGAAPTLATVTSATTTERAQPHAAVTCRSCSKPMVKRTAKRGLNAGSDFWGCTGFPACRETRRIAGQSSG